MVFSRQILGQGALGELRSTMMSRWCRPPSNVFPMLRHCTPYYFRCMNSQEKPEVLGRGWSHLKCVVVRQGVMTDDIHTVSSRRSKMMLPSSCTSFRMRWCWSICWFICSISDYFHCPYMGCPPPCTIWVMQNGSTNLVMPSVRLMHPGLVDEEQTLVVSLVTPQNQSHNLAIMTIEIFDTCSRGCGVCTAGTGRANMEN